MANINKRKEINDIFNQLTEENQEYVFAILRGLVYDQDNESEGGMWTLPQNGRYDGPSLN